MSKYKVYLRADCAEGKQGEVIEKPNENLITKARADSKHRIYRLFPMPFEDKDDAQYDKKNQEKTVEKAEKAELIKKKKL